MPRSFDGGPINRAYALVTMLIKKERYRAECAQLLGLDDDGVNAYFKSMLDEGLIEEVGRRKTKAHGSAMYYRWVGSQP